METTAENQEIVYHKPRDWGWTLSGVSHGGKTITCKVIEEMTKSAT